GLDQSTTGQSPAARAMPVGSRGENPAAESTPPPARYVAGRRGGGLRRRGRYPLESQDWSGLDGLGPAERGVHPWIKREALSGRGQGRAHGANPLGGKRPEEQLALLGSAAQAHGGLCPGEGDSRDLGQLWHS